MSELNNGNQGLFAMRRVNFWVVANVLGLACFLFFASKLWAPQGDKGLLGGPGDPLIWMLSAFPFLLIFFVVNCVWVGRVIAMTRKNGIKPLLVWAIIAICWIGAFSLDHVRSYDGSEVAPSANALHR